MHNINRPLSPHITIYNVQKSSTFSIWHRISGVIMFSLILSPLLLLKFSLFFFKPFFWFMLIKNLVILKWFFTGVIIIITATFLYHIFNGIRHFLWDSVMQLSVQTINNDSNVLLLLICSFLFIKFYWEY